MSLALTTSTRVGVVPEGFGRDLQLRGGGRRAERRREVERLEGVHGMLGLMWAWGHDFS